MTQSIIMLGQTLGLQVIAEGVETYGQLDYLERHGCNAYQGFLFSRPLTLAKLENTYPQQFGYDKSYRIIRQGLTRSIVH